MFPTPRAPKQLHIIRDPPPHFTFMIVFFKEYSVPFFLQTFGTAFQPKCLIFVSSDQSTFSQNLGFDTMFVRKIQSSKNVFSLKKCFFLGILKKMLYRRSRRLIESVFPFIPLTPCPPWGSLSGTRGSFPNFLANNLGVRSVTFLGRPEFFWVGTNGMTGLPLTNYLTY